VLEIEPGDELGNGIGRHLCGVLGYDRRREHDQESKGAIHEMVDHEIQDTWYASVRRTAMLINEP